MMTPEQIRETHSYIEATARIYCSGDNAWMREDMEQELWVAFLERPNCFCPKHEAINILRGKRYYDGYHNPGAPRPIFVRIDDVEIIQEFRDESFINQLGELLTPHQRRVYKTLMEYCTPTGCVMSVDVAAVFGCTSSNISKAISKIRRRLRDAISDYK